MAGWGLFIAALVFLAVFYTKKKKELENIDEKYKAAINKNIEYAESLKKYLVELSSGIHNQISEAGKTITLLSAPPEPAIKSSKRRSGIGLDAFITGYEKCFDIPSKKEYLIKKFPELQTSGQKTFIIEHFVDIPFELQPQLLEVIGTGGGEEAGGKFLMERLGDSSGEVRLRAADILGVLRYKPAAEKLIEMLKETDAFSRAGIVDALVKIGGAVVRDHFYKQLETGAHLEKKEAETALALLKK